MRKYTLLYSFGTQPPSGLWFCMDIWLMQVSVCLWCFKLKHFQKMFNSAFFYSAIRTQPFRTEAVLDSLHCVLQNKPASIGNTKIQTIRHRWCLHVRPEIVHFPITTPTLSPKRHLRRLFWVFQYRDCLTRLCCLLVSLACGRPNFTFAVWLLLPADQLFQIL